MHKKTTIISNDDAIIQNLIRNHLLEIEDRELTIIVTTKCNHKCIMCPQKLNIDLLQNDLEIQRALENFDYSKIDGITFTGGEPFIKMNLVELALEKSPQNILITVLSNGSILPSQKILESGRVKICTPLYAPFDELHNFLTGSQSFYKVIKNLMKISSYNIPIELRFVITKYNSKYLQEFARFIWRNLPFVQDVAFMGIELTESARKNKDALWINPKEYVRDLEKAVSYLSDFKISAWIYNLPFCLFDDKYQNFLVKSISTWKIRYLEKCKTCTKKEKCGGMFFSDVKEFEKII